MDIDLTLNVSEINSAEIFNSFNATSFEELLNSLNIRSFEEEFEWTDEKIARLIQIVIRPILIIGGTVGNGLTLYIMRRPSLNHLSTCFYMFILALADTMVLWTGCLAGWLQTLSRRKIDMRAWTDCKLFYFLFYFGRHYSSMLLVLLSLVKCFAVYFPLKSKTFCTVKRAKWATAIVAGLVTGCNLIYFIAKESRKLFGYYFCHQFDKFRVTLDVMDSILYSFGPFTLICISYSAIAFKLLRHKSKNDSAESTSQAVAKSATRGTAMVVIVSVTFLILTTPTAVNMVQTFANQPANHPLYRAFMNITQYLNHSINGVLYCSVGSKFREEFLKIFRRYQNRGTNSNGHSADRTNINGDTA